MKHLQAHVEEWLELRYKHGAGLDDRHLRIMFLSTIPSALEDEISLKDDLGNTLSAAVEFVLARTNRSRERELVERLAKDRKANLNINAVTQSPPASEQPNKQVQQFTDCPDLVNQLKNLAAALKTQERGRTQDRRGRGATSSRSPGGSPGRNANGSKKFRPDPKSGRCWHCDDPGHTTKECAEYQALLKANGGKRPANYKSAAERKWEQGKGKSGSVKALIGNQWLRRPRIPTPKVSAVRLSKANSKSWDSLYLMLCRRRLLQSAN